MVESIYWKDARLRGNRALQKIHPLMLDDEGYAVTRRYKPTNASDKHEIRILYDRGYVLEKIATLLEPLLESNRVSARDIYELIAEAVQTETRD